MAGNVWIGHQTTDDARLRLFCFPFAGGGALAYRAWLTQFPSDIDVVPVALPGREQRFGEPAIDDIATMIKALSAGLQPLMDRPFAFFGYSMGALIAHHLACHLQQKGVATPGHLFVAARRGPNGPNGPDGANGPGGAVQHSSLHHLSSDAFWQGIASYGATPDEILENADYRALFEPSLRADFKLSETAISAGLPRLSCPITAFGGADDTNPLPDELAGWADATTGRFTSYILPGGHFFLRNAGDDMIEIVREALAS